MKPSQSSSSKLKRLKGPLPGTTDWNKEHALLSGNYLLILASFLSPSDVANLSCTCKQARDGLLFMRKDKEAGIHGYWKLKHKGVLNSDWRGFDVHLTIHKWCPSAPPLFLSFPSLTSLKQIKDHMCEVYGDYGLPRGNTVWEFLYKGVYQEEDTLLFHVCGRHFAHRHSGCNIELYTAVRPFIYVKPVRSRALAKH